MNTMPSAVTSQSALPSPVLGMLIFLIVELMLFAALFSAFWIVSAALPQWPPADQPRLPVLTTAGNTLVLLLSGVALWRSHRFLRSSDNLNIGRRWYLVSLVLGTVFIVVQGTEWVGLVRYGLTLTSSVYGGFFYLIVGTHALHAVSALIALLWMYFRLTAGRLTPPAFRSVQFFWYFVVGIWPVLYVLVYLK